MIKNKIKAGLITICAFAVMAPAAFASDGTTAVVTGGSLTITNPQVSAFENKTVTGFDQTTNANLDAFMVSDLRGTGAGWHVTAQADTFVGVSHSLATSSLEMSEPTVSANGTTSPEPGIYEGPYTLDGGSVAVVASADTDEGMGKYDFSATTLTLSLPANVYADTYASTVTIDVVTAP